MVDYKLNYDGEASGPFTEGELLTFGGGGTAELVILYDNGTNGEMYISLISGSVPANDESITGGTSAATANVDGTPFISRFPVKIREDTSYAASSGNIRWTGPALGTTHSCKYDNEASGPFVVNEILTFGNGSTGELIQLTDNGTSGELFIRMIDVAFPTDNDTITGGTSGATANVDGAFHIRAYTPNNIHYWYSDKGDDATSTGNDEQDRTKPRISQRVGVTDVLALGNANIDDTMSYHMYGGSWVQGGGSPTEYNAMSIAVIDVDGATEPVLIQNNTLLSATTGEYWKNAYMPDAANRINVLIKVNNAGSVIDRRVVRVRALEYTRNYFTAPDATLSSGIAPVTLVAVNDGNNSTAAGTVATWTDAVLTYGFQSVDHNNGNGGQPYWAVGDLGSRTKQQFHERFKWVQRRGTSETIFGLNAQLIVGNDLTFAYDAEVGGPFTEGETLTFGNGGTALLLALDDDGTTGNLYCQRLTGDAPPDNDTITGGTSGATAAVNGTPTTRVIINNLVGTFTGSDFNPANIGITLEASDAGNGDLFTDLLGVNQQPPNNQTGTVNTTIGNTITAYPYDGTATDPTGDPEPDFDFLTLSTALTGAAETSVVVNTTIPTWFPQSGGALRITTDSGIRQLIEVISYTGNTFTIPSTDFSGDNASISNGVMPAPLDGIDDTSFAGVYTSDQEFVIRVTNGSAAIPKQPFTTTAVFGSGGFSVNITLQDD